MCFRPLWLLIPVLIVFSSWPILAAPDAAVPPPDPALEERAARALQDTVPLLKTILSAGTRHYSAEKLAIALAQLGRVDEGLAVLPPPDFAGDNQPVEMGDRVLQVAARRFAWRGDTKNALSLVEKIRGSSSRADALFAVARAHLRARNVTEAKAVLHLAAPLAHDSKKPIVVAYAAYLLAEAGDREEARRLFDAVKPKRADAGQPPANQPPANPLRSVGSPVQDIALLEAKAGFYDEAMATAGPEFWARTRVQEVLMAHRQFEKVRSLIENLPEAIQAREWSNLAMRQVLADDREGARASLARLRKLVEGNTAIGDARPQEQHSRMWTLQFVTLALGEALLGDLEKSRATYAQASQMPGFSPQAAITYWMGLAAPREFPLILKDPAARREALTKALDSVRNLPPGDANRDSISMQIARAQHEMGDKATALATLREVAQTARDALVKNRGGISGTLATIAGLQRDWGDAEGMTQSLAWLREGVAQRKSTSMPYFLASAGFFEEAFAELEKTPPPGGTWTNVVDYLVEKRGAGAALDWAQTLRDPARRVVALQRVVEAITPRSAEEKELVISGDGANTSISASLGVGNLKSSSVGR